MILRMLFFIIMQKSKLIHKILYPWKKQVLTKMRNDLKYLQRPEMTNSRQEAAWNDLQEKEITWNNPQRVRDNLQWPEFINNKEKKRRETTSSKQILILFYNMGQSVFFSNTFCTQHLITIIRACFHGKSWWK